MELILPKSVKTLTGMLGSDFGYAVRNQKNGHFYLKRNSRTAVPPDGHLRAIFAFAGLAQDGLYVLDIRLTAREFKSAIEEAGKIYGSLLLSMRNTYILSAREVLEIKKLYNL